MYLFREASKQMAETVEPNKPASPDEKPPKSPNKSKSKAKQKKSPWINWISNATALIVGAVAGAVAAALLQPHDSNQHQQQSIAKPVVHVSNVVWIPQTKGRYEVDGTAVNLAAGEVLWTFNQPVPNNNPGYIYPDPGPCAPDANHIFKCSLGFATDASGTNYNIIVAVVTDQQAYIFAEQKAGLIDAGNYSSIADLPHVDGANTVAQMQSTKTNS